jgi:hypothetical protein
VQPTGGEIFYDDRLTLRQYMPSAHAAVWASTPLSRRRDANNSRIDSIKQGMQYWGATDARYRWGQNKSGGGPETLHADWR